MRMKRILLLGLLIVNFSACSDEKSELLISNKPWKERTEFEKLIGVWCSAKYRPGTGNTVVSQTMEFQTKIYFYSDHTFKETQLADSYLNSESELDSGTDVQVKDGVLTYKSKNYGEKSRKIELTESTLKIEDFLTIAGYGGLTKCN